MSQRQKIAIQVVGFALFLVALPWIFGFADQYIRFVGNHFGWGK